MIILAFLQNQWFREPEKVKRMYEEHPEQRNRLIEAFLFMGCTTGRRIRKTFGEDLCDLIIWEEASSEIGGKASSFFRAEPAHIKKAIELHKPDIILTFGVEAKRALNQVWKGTIIHCPHPAARGKEIVPTLYKCADELRQVIGNV